ncbi:rhodanese-like domain-containing protein [Methylobacter tundripaludum]|uniref:rhodanese-like domain-containing protein n=1 Tax=Methylobacter tundripaludum TaxID=173365 RepID=UPI000483D382|nr:rhodanese-like domain-containing protein [Methylobacter tundripaludum]
MKKLTKLMLLMTVLATPVAFGAAHDHDKKADAPAAKEYKYKTPKLNRAQLDALLAKPEQLLIIDVRRPDELTKIGGFPVYLSIQSKEIENSLAFIPKDRDIVTVSNHAGRAGAAADLLAAKGFKVVGAVGAQNYEEEGGKLARIEIPAPKPATEQK